MHLTANEKKLLVLGVLFTAILFGMKLAFPWLGGVTGYVVYEQKTNGWDFESPPDYFYDSDLIEVAGGMARLKLQTASTAITDDLNSRLDSGSPDSIAITNLNPPEYETALLEEDDEYYIRGNKKITEIPEELEGLLWIKTDDRDKNKEINVSFGTETEVTVFVGYDARDEAPYWLSRWTYWGEGIGTTADKGTPFKIYYKGFESGSVLLGSSNRSKAMYVILVNATAYEGSKQTVSQPYGYSGKITKIEWDAETPEGTSVKLRFREAATEDELEDAPWSGYYTESGSEIDGQVSNGFVQHEALLETADNSKTPVLRGVTLTSEEKSYPNSAKIETPDISVSKVSGWGSMVIDEELNGQSTGYEYSTDSGGTWAEASGGDLSSASTQSGRLRIRAELASDGLQTPSIDGVTINYTYVSCEESWEAHYTACNASDTRIKYYTDANSCGTRDGMPEDGGTSESCDYCTPSISCSGYGKCQPDGMKACLSLADGNGCYEKTGLSSDSYSASLPEFSVECPYDSEQPVISGITVSPNAVSPGDLVKITASITDGSNLTALAILRNEKKNAVAGEVMSLANGSFRAVINTSSLMAGTYRVDVYANDTNGNRAAIGDARLLAVTEKSAVVKKLELSNLTGSINKTNPATNATDVFLEISGKSGSDGEISVITYETDAMNTTKPAKEVGRYVDIVVDGMLQQNITSTALRIYYTDGQLSSANINENSIRIHFYNETSGEWEQLKTTLNTEQNYAEAVIYHYSTYGIFGEENPPASPSQSPSGGEGGYGGSGGGTITTTKTAKTEEVAQTAESTPQKTAPEALPPLPKKENCSYDVAVEIPETLNMATMTTATGKATNTGTCDIESLELRMTGRANELIGVTPSSIGYMKAGSTSAFNLTKLSQNIAPFQGLIVAEQQNGVTTYTGALHFEAMSGNVITVADEVQLTIELNGGKGKGRAKWQILAFSAAIAAAVSGALIIRRKKRPEETAKV